MPIFLCIGKEVAMCSYVALIKCMQPPIITKLLQWTFPQKAGLSLLSLAGLLTTRCLQGFAFPLG